MYMEKELQDPHATFPTLNDLGLLLDPLVKPTVSYTIEVPNSTL